MTYKETPEGKVWMINQITMGYTNHNTGKKYFKTSKEAWDRYEAFNRGWAECATKPELVDDPELTCDKCGQSIQKATS